MMPKLSLQPYFGRSDNPDGADMDHSRTVVFLEREFVRAPVPCTGRCGAVFGVFSTGLTASLAMTWIPSQYGHWNLKAGFQWYDILNTR